MRRTLFFTGLTGILAVAAMAAGYLSVDALMKDSKKQDKKDVTVRGRIERFAGKTSKSGNKYTTFVLAGEKAKVNVYMREHLAKPPKNGDLVEVKGLFRLEKKVGERVFKNEIEITPVKGKTYGLKKLD